MPDEIPATGRATPPVRPPAPELATRMTVDADGRVRYQTLTAAELTDRENLAREDAAEQDARTKLLGDREAAAATLLDAARTDPVAAAVAVLLGL